MQNQPVLTAIILPPAYDPDQALAPRLLLSYVWNNASDTLTPQEKYWMTLWRLGVDRSRTMAEFIGSQTENAYLKLACQHAVTITDGEETNGGPPKDIIEHFKEVVDLHRVIETGIRDRLIGSITRHADDVLALYRGDNAFVDAIDDPLAYATLIYDDADGRRFEVQLPLRPLTDVTFALEAREEPAVASNG